MLLALVVSGIALLLKLCTIKELGQYKTAPIKEGSVFFIVVAVLTTYAGLFAFGPPISPAMVTTIMIVLMVPV